MKINIVGTLGILALTAGCVSSSKYREGISERDEKIKKLDTSLEEMRKALAEMQAREAEQQKRLQEFSDLTRRFKKLIDAGTLSVRIVDGKMVVSMGTDVLFPSGSAKLSPNGLTTVKAVATQLNSIPEKKYQVEGHTDNVPIKSAQFPSNWELAAARSLTVVKTMIDGGMPSNRLSAASFGDTSPVAPNATTEEKALNRRIEIVIVPDLSSLPGYEELQKYSNEQSKKAGDPIPTKSPSPAKTVAPAKPGTTEGSEAPSAPTSAPSRPSSPSKPDTSNPSPKAGH